MTTEKFTDMFNAEEIMSRVDLDSFSDFYCINYDEFNGDIVKLHEAYKKEVELAQKKIERIQEDIKFKSNKAYYSVKNIKIMKAAIKMLTPEEIFDCFKKSCANDGTENVDVDVEVIIRIRNCMHVEIPNGSEAEALMAALAGKPVNEDIASLFISE